jgi:hypothetical protein
VAEDDSLASWQPGHSGNLQASARAQDPGSTVIQNLLEDEQLSEKIAAKDFQHFKGILNGGMALI